MRKVINGKVYDTETAHEVGYWYNGWGGNDYRSTTLYRKRTGEYFVHCQRGEFDYSEVIDPMSFADAYDWASGHLEQDAFSDEFGLPDEDGEHDLHVILTDAAWQAIARTAVEDGVTVRNVIERLAATL